MHSFVYGITFVLTAFMAAQFAVAAPVVVADGADSLLQVISAVAFVGGAVLLIFVFRGAFKALRDVVGGGGFASDAQRRWFFANNPVSAESEADAFNAEMASLSGTSQEFDQHNMATWESAHFTAYQAGLTEVRDKVGEESWSTDQWLAFDAGRDAHHEAYLASLKN
jgi:hypothetical protein